MANLFGAWQTGWDPYASSTPSIYSFNPAKFYAEQLPAGDNTMLGGAPPPGTIPMSTFATQWLVPFIVIVIAIAVLESSGRGKGFGFSWRAGAGAGAGPS